MLMRMRKRNACHLVCSCWCNVALCIVLHLQKSVMHKEDDEDHHLRGRKDKGANHGLSFLLNWFSFWVMPTSSCILVKHLCMKKMVSLFDRSWIHEGGRCTPLHIFPPGIFPHLRKRQLDTLVSMHVGTLLKCCVPDWFKSRDNLLDRRWTLIKKLIVVCIHEGNKALQHLHASQFLASAYALQHFAVTRHYEMWPTQNRITYRKSKISPVVVAWKRGITRPCAPWICNAPVHQLAMTRNHKND